MDMILRKDERIARLAFSSLRDILKFQQAVTGFKSYVSYIQCVNFHLHHLHHPAYLSPY
jgi:hypothetical protein